MISNPNMKRKPSKDSKPTLTYAQQLSGFSRDYKEESNTRKLKVKEEDREWAARRRRIEDIKLGLDLEAEGIKEVWE